MWDNFCEWPTLKDVYPDYSVFNAYFNHYITADINRYIEGRDALKLMKRLIESEKFNNLINDLAQAFWFAYSGNHIHLANWNIEYWEERFANALAYNSLSVVLLYQITNKIDFKDILNFAMGANITSSNSSENDGNYQQPGGEMNREAFTTSGSMSDSISTFGNKLNVLVNKWKNPTITSPSAFVRSFNNLFTMSMEW